MILNTNVDLIALDSRQKIAKLKTAGFLQAIENAITIRNNEQAVIGRLIPIGQWIENDNDKINSICRWRNSSNKMFPTQMEATYESTLDYINKTSITNEYGILFGIFDVNDVFIGHIGITNIINYKFELAHLIRGINNGDPKLVFFSEVSLLDWCFRELRCNISVVEIMSYNWIVSMLHKDIGFEISACYPLKRIEHKSGDVTHQVVEPNEANVKYSIVKMQLDKNNFYKQVDWLI